MEVIITTADGLREMVEELKAGKKIAAIKALRRTATPPPGEKTLGLREAKLAVERYAFEVLRLPDAPNHSGHSEGKRIIAGPAIKELLVDFGDGQVTVDVEGLELKALSQLESIGLEACGRMLELCEVIKAFSNGKRVGVIEDA